MKHEPQSPPWSKGTGTDIAGSSGTASNRGPAAMATVVLPQPKQIRFVNNEGRPPAKRRRVDSAYAPNISYLFFNSSSRSRTTAEPFFVNDLRPDS